jgi:hypothetical protein
MKKEDKIKKDIRILLNFIKIYCLNNHNGEEKGYINIHGKMAGYVAKDGIQLCKGCRKLLLHAIAKRIYCPFDPKPACKKCPSYCYAPYYREAIKKVMRYSGLYLIKRGRFDLIIKYYF